MRFLGSGAWLESDDLSQAQLSFFVPGTNRGFCARHKSMVWCLAPLKGTSIFEKDWYRRLILRLAIPVFFLIYEKRASFISRF
jgi:hypothetical protein